MAEIAARPRKGLLIWMIVSQFLAAALVLFFGLGAGLAPLGFGPGETMTTGAWALTILIWASPLIPIVLIIAAWIAYARKKDWLAAVLSGLSITPLLILAWWVENG